jgi:hypothetical protein
MVHERILHLSASSASSASLGSIHGADILCSIGLVSSALAGAQRLLHSIIECGLGFFTDLANAKGYVLSFRSLVLIREGTSAQLLDSLASSVFRRWIRLYLPTLVSMFTGYFLLARLGLWTEMPKVWERSEESSWIRLDRTSFPDSDGSLMQGLQSKPLS